MVIHATVETHVFLTVNAHILFVTLELGLVTDGADRQVFRHVLYRGSSGFHSSLERGEVILDLSANIRNDWCFKPQFCTVRLSWAGDNLG